MADPDKNPPESLWDRLSASMRDLNRRYNPLAGIAEVVEDPKKAIEAKRKREDEAEAARAAGVKKKAERKSLLDLLK